MEPPQRPPAAPVDIVVALTDGADKCVPQPVGCRMADRGVGGPPDRDAVGLEPARQFDTLPPIAVRVAETVALQHLAPEGDVVGIEMPGPGDAGLSGVGLEEPETREQTVEQLVLRQIGVTADHLHVGPVDRVEHVAKPAGIGDDIAVEEDDHFGTCRCGTQVLLFEIVQPRRRHIADLTRPVGRVELVLDGQARHRNVDLARIVGNQQFEARIVRARIGSCLLAERRQHLACAPHIRQQRVFPLDHDGNS